MEPKNNIDRGVGCHRPGLFHALGRDGQAPTRRLANAVRWALVMIVVYTAINLLHTAAAERRPDTEAQAAAI